jgi:hypothetical protein
MRFYIEENVEHHAFLSSYPPPAIYGTSSLAFSLQAAQKRGMNGGAPLKTQSFLCFQICQHTNRV